MTISSPPARSARERRRGVAVGFDFTAPVRLSRDHARVLELAVDTFARQWTTRLASTLRVTAAVEFIAVQQEPYERYIDRLEAPTPVALFSADGPGGTGLLQLAPQTVLNYLDHALGGPGGEQTRRDLTDIEVQVTRELCTTALSVLGYAFAAITPLTPVLLAVQQNPALLQAARASDMMLVGELTITVGEHEHPATLVLPMAGLMARLVALSSQDGRSAAEQARELEAAAVLDDSLRDVPVDVAVRCVPLSTSPEYVLGLSVGDVVRMAHPLTRPLEIATSDIVVAHAVPTTTGPRRACLVVDTEEDSR